MWLNKLTSHSLEAVRIMLPLLTSFPLEEFVLSIAAEAYFMARKQLVNKMVNKSNFWNVKKKLTHESVLTRMMFIKDSTEVSANACSE
jgi:hypothetical protein